MIIIAKTARQTLAVLSLTGAIVFTLPGHALAHDGGHGTEGSGGSAVRGQLQTADQAPVTLRARMSGGQEVGTVGDPDARARITIALDPATGRVAYSGFRQSYLLALEGETITKLHIHKGVRGTNGDVVVDLTEAALANLLNGSVTADRAVVARIAANPGNYYVNVHTAAFPDGAVRGQLRAGKRW